jgi:outer membrane protein assembly factor BamE (lipoprotein component of BamABCDE complex)
MSGGSALSMRAFYEVPVGASESQVVEMMGRPVSTQKNEDGSVQYEYVERYKAGGRNIEERRYCILFKEGRVASKQMKQNSPAPFYFDSYDMQTTQNESEK